MASEGEECRAQMLQMLREASSSVRTMLLLEMLGTCSALELKFLHMRLDDVLAHHPTSKQFQEDEQQANNVQRLSKIVEAHGITATMHLLAGYVPLLYRTNASAATIFADIMVKCPWHAASIGLMPGSENIFCRVCHETFLFALSHPAFPQERERLVAALNQLLQARGQAPVAAAENEGPTIVQRARLYEVSKDPARKDYTFHIEVTWASGRITQARRMYKDFFDFQCKLLDAFPDQEKSDTRAIPFLPGKKFSLRGADKKQRAVERMPLLAKYLDELVSTPPRISQCSHVISFFQSCANCLNLASVCTCTQMGAQSTPLEQPMPGVPVMAANAAMPTPFGFAAETAMFASSMGMQYFNPFLGAQPLMAQPVYMPMMPMPVYAAGAGQTRPYVPSPLQRRGAHGPMPRTPSMTSLQSIGSNASFSSLAPHSGPAVPAAAGGSATTGPLAGAVTSAGGSTGSMMSSVSMPDLTAAQQPMPARSVSPASAIVSIQHHQQQPQHRDGDAGGRASPAPSIDSISSTDFTISKKRTSSVSSLRCLACRAEGHTVRECQTADREGLLAVLEEHNCPIPENSDISLVAERFNWLKTLRLHKYAPLFLAQDLAWFEHQTEDSLKALGVTSGASKKLVVKIATDPEFPWRDRPPKQAAEADKAGEPVFGADATTGGNPAAAPEAPAAAPAVAVAVESTPVSTPAAASSSSPSRSGEPKRSWADELDDD